MHSAVEVRGERKALDLSIKRPEPSRAMSGWTETSRVGLSPPRRSGSRIEKGRQFCR